MNDVWELVMEDMKWRRKEGIARYGAPVVAESPNDWLQHAYEEALGMAVYLKAEIERRKLADAERRAGNHTGEG